MFGQILAALYQEDIVEEDDIRGWHILPSTSDDDGREGVERDNFRKCWTIGTHMIQQFDDQDSGESDSEVEKPTPVTAPAVIATKGGHVDPDEDDSDETSSAGTGVPEGGEVSEDASEDASEECSTATSTNASEDEDESEETSN